MSTVRAAKHLRPGGIQSPAGTAAMSSRASPVRNLALYEELIGRGIMGADERGSAIDHVTARRLAIWLLPRSQREPEFMRGLIRFAKTGAVTSDLKTQLRNQARSPSHPNRPYAARLLQYAVARGGDRGPIGENFGAVCDAITANAITANAVDREAHTREVQRYGQALPADSYGRRNREVIAARETHIAARLRAIKRAYRAAVEFDPAPAPQPAQLRILDGRTPDYELEME
jgi:hypothetical protein